MSISVSVAVSLTALRSSRPSLYITLDGPVVVPFTASAPEGYVWVAGDVTIRVQAATPTGTTTDVPGTITTAGVVDEVTDGAFAAAVDAAGATAPATVTVRVLGASVEAVAPGGFAPSDLPDIVSYYDPSDISTLWQDAARTIPVAADGDPVRVMDDLSSAGRHVIAGSDAARPIYRTVGGLHWIETDGVDDFLLADFAAVSMTSSVMAFAGRSVGGSWQMAVGIEQEQGKRSITGLQSGTIHFAEMDFTNTTTDARTNRGSYTVGADFVQVLENDATAGESRLYLNGVGDGGEGTASWGANTGLLAVDRISVGSRQDGGDRWNGRIYAAVVTSGTLTTQERTDLNAWLAAKAGVTL